MMSAMGTCAFTFLHWQKHTAHTQAHYCQYLFHNIYFIFLNFIAAIKYKFLFNIKRIMV